MKLQEITIRYIACTKEELHPKQQALIERAIEATENSYSPYSGFSVGAAVMLSDGTIVTGANQENAVFPVSLCAERTAIFAAQAQYPELPPVRLAVAARNADGFIDKPISPCGSCRQVIAQMEQRYGNEIEILLYGRDCVYVLPNSKSLLPFAFGDEYMRS